MKMVAQKIDGPFKGARLSILTGAAVILLGFAGVGGWAATAPLASASIASGVVAVSSKRQTVQHLEGGIIGEILVREGQEVAAGDLLVRLDEIRAQANFELVQGQYLAALGEKSRLEAERDGLESVNFPDELVERTGSPEIEKIVRGQRNVFESRRTYLMGQQKIIGERKLQLEKEIDALEAQQKAETRQLELIQEEIGSVADLVKKGLERTPRLLALRRTEAEIEGKRGELLAHIARSHQAISELEAQLMDMQNKMMTEVVQQLREAEVRLSDLTQRLRATQDVLERIEIRAPRAGFVVNLAYHTVGGVIEPGKPILDIVPSEDNLLIEARFSPRDIDVLEVGLPATVTLSAYNQRSVPPIDGTLVMLSADHLIDTSTNEPFYSGYVEVDRAELEELDGVRLVPGMPVEVMVKTGERTALAYLIDPVQRSMNRAFRED